MEYKDRKKVQEREKFHVFRENTLTRECLWTKIRTLGNVTKIKNFGGNENEIEKSYACGNRYRQIS